LKTGGAPKASDQDVVNDWALLQQILQSGHRRTEGNDARLTAMRSASP
jgi:hypothetical protein